MGTYYFDVVLFSFCSLLLSSSCKGVNFDYSCFQLLGCSFLPFLFFDLLFLLSSGSFVELGLEYLYHLR